MKLLLSRTKEDETGTHGNIIDANGKLVCYTLEPMWKQNEANDSCIPPGSYDCIPHSGDKFTDVWEVTNIPNRTAVLIHPGNTIADTHGCILVGLVPYINGVMQSRQAIIKLHSVVQGGFQLNIQYLPGSRS
jgi:hypothetical protein